MRLVVAQPAFIVEGIGQILDVQLHGADKRLVGNVPGLIAAVICEIPLDERVPAGGAFRHGDGIGILIAKPNARIDSAAAELVIHRAVLSPVDFAVLCPGRATVFPLFRQQHLGAGHTVGQRQNIVFSRAKMPHGKTVLHRFAIPGDVLLRHVAEVCQPGAFVEIELTGETTGASSAIRQWSTVRALVAMGIGTISANIALFVRIGAGYISFQPHKGIHETRRKLDRDFCSSVNRNRLSRVIPQIPDDRTAGIPGHNVAKLIQHGLDPIRCSGACLDSFAAVRLFDRQHQVRMLFVPADVDGAGGVLPVLCTGAASGIFGGAVRACIAGGGGGGGCAVRAGDRLR